MTSPMNGRSNTSTFRPNPRPPQTLQASAVAAAAGASPQRSSSVTGSEGPTPPPMQFGGPLPQHVGRPVTAAAAAAAAAAGQQYPFSTAAGPPMSPISENSSVSSGVPNSDATNGPGNSSSTVAPLPAAIKSEVINSSHVANGDSGFNSSCQQCLAERVAAAAVAADNRNSVAFSIVDSTDGPENKVRSGGQFPSLPSDETVDHQRRDSDVGPPARTYECEVWCRETSRLLAGCLGVCCLAAGYAAIGGLLFMAIESRAAVESADASAPLAAETVMETPNVTLPAETLAQVARARGQTVDRLWRVTERMNILYPENWTRQAADEMQWFQDQLTKAFATEFRALRAAQASQQADSRVLLATHFRPAPREWSYPRGLLYAVSLLTAVGCGFDWAVSPLSRLLTVLYLLIGAPVMYLYLSTTGALLARAITFAVARISCRYGGAHVRIGSGSRRPLIKRRKRRSGGGSSREKSDGGKKTAATSSQSPFYAGAASDRMSMTQLSRRSTWQTCGSGSVVAVSNGSISTLSDDQTSLPQLAAVGTESPPAALLYCACFILIFCHVLCGAALLSPASEWRFSEAVYFCLLATMTVGTGGLRLPEPALLACAAYLFVGAAVLSACLHVAWDKVYGVSSRRRGGSSRMVGLKRHCSLMNSLDSIGVGARNVNGGISNGR